jgi:CheY-like chemotaxis protein
MVVEDDEPTRCLFDEFLTEAGYRTSLHGECLSALTAIQHEHPDLIILDIWLEQADAGWYLLRNVHQDLATRYIPVVVCSAHAFMLGTMAETLPEPHYAFVAKPFQIDDVLAQVQRLLHKVPSAEQSMERVPD